MFRFGLLLSCRALLAAPEGPPKALFLVDSNKACDASDCNVHGTVTGNKGSCICSCNSGWGGVTCTDAPPAPDGQAAASPEKIPTWQAILYIFGISYLMLAIYLACDECFLPAVTEMCHQHDIPAPEAGVHFIALGLSLPIFVCHAWSLFSTRGTATLSQVISAAAFNLLYLPGVCAWVGPGKKIQWFPIRRDLSFYLVAAAGMVKLFLSPASPLSSDINHHPVWFYLQALAVFAIYLLHWAFTQGGQGGMSRLFEPRDNLDQEFLQVYEDPDMLDDDEFEQTGKWCLRAHRDVLRSHMLNPKSHTWRTSSPLDMNIASMGMPLNYTVLYYIGMPVVALLHLTVPDVRLPAGKTHAVMAYVVSIVWVVAFVFFVDAMGGEVAWYFGTPPTHAAFQVTWRVWSSHMPLFFAGLLMASQGYFSMAAGTSIGCSFFLVAVIFPVNWLIYSAVSSSGVPPISPADSTYALVLILLAVCFATSGFAKPDKIYGGALVGAWGIFTVAQVLHEMGRHSSD